jgi:hypothetical protein
MMTPAEQAAELCRARDASFREELEAHLLNGWVISTPEVFLLGRPVPRSADAADLRAVYPPEECDAWFVWLGVGSAERLLALMPYDLPWIGWHRQGRAWRSSHWVSTTALRRRLAWCKGDR